MGYIHLKTVKVYAYHGCLNEETTIGSDYIVNLSVHSDLSTSALSDQLEDTVDYVALNAIIKEEMAIPSKLLEHVAQRIIDRVFDKHASVDKVLIEVEKVNPPIGGDVMGVSVEMLKSR